MSLFRKILSLACVGGMLLALAACQPQPSPAYTEAGHPIVDWPYSSNMVYARTPDLLKTYTKFIIARPVIMNSDEDAFPDVSLEEQATMLFFTRQAYSQAFQRNNFKLVEQAGPGVAQVRIYLVDMRPSQPVAEGVVYKTPIGELDLTDADFRGRSTFTGGVTLIGTITDSVSGQTLMGFVESSSQTNLDPVRAFGRWFPAQSAIEASANSLAIGWRALMKR